MVWFVQVVSVSEVFWLAEWLGGCLPMCMHGIAT